jgi:hypothetical protein
MQELIKALIKAKAEFNPIPKDRTNPHYKHKYATLDAVLDAVTPALGKYGLVVIQTTELCEGKTVLRTHLYHESGESITSAYPLPEISDSQKFGAALTYARRYAVCAILSVTADEDNDAHQITTTKKTESAQNNIRFRKQDSTPTSSVKEQDLRVKEIRLLLDYPLDLIKGWLASQNVNSPSELETTRIDELIRLMCLDWAEDRVDPNHAASSYQQQVISAVGTDQLMAIKAWKNYVLGQRVAVSANSRNEQYEPSYSGHAGHSDNYGDR